MDGGKRIADAVHGTVVLDPVEAAVISTRAYQRLRGVKHLGLASLAFPGADYSRFAHGIGTLHVTSLILDALRHNVPGSLSDDDVRLYRIAALLHDIGHYPFSHTFERALKNYYSETHLLRPTGAGSDPLDGDTAEVAPEGNWLHEELGTHVIEEDGELCAVLTDASIDMDALTGIITRSNPPKFANLVSSDLDADRTDYLMRTAVHTGLPYGNVDLPYLLSQIRIDNEQRICFTLKGMRAAEHLLLSRYFDYQQVSFHKTVAGLELVLNDAIGSLLRTGRLQCTPTVLRQMIQDSRWYSFDDGHITALMRDALRAGTAGDDAPLFRAILHRRPPKLVADRERLGAGNESTILSSLEKLAHQHRAAWAADYGCRFYVWTQKGTLTKIGSSVPLSVLGDNSEDEMYDKLQQAVRIRGSGGSSRPIQENPRSLISVLGNYALYSVRVYALLEPDQECRREEISTRINGDLLDMWLPD